MMFLIDSSRVPEFGKWAFMLPRGEVLKEKWGQIPVGIDILITHGPPLGKMCYQTFSSLREIPPTDSQSCPICGRDMDISRKYFPELIIL